MSHLRVICDAGLARPAPLAANTGSAALSSLDLFDDAPVLLTGSAGTDWIEALAGIAPRMPVWAYRIGRDLLDPEDRFEQLYGMDGAGAVLVRPDGRVGFRARTGTDKPTPRPATHSMRSRDRVGPAAAAALTRTS